MYTNHNLQTQPIRKKKKKAKKAKPRERTPSLQEYKTKKKNEKKKIVSRKKGNLMKGVMIAFIINDSITKRSFDGKRLPAIPSLRLS